MWDAENHDMSMYHEIMRSINVLMQKRRPDLRGHFTIHEYNLEFGKLYISYYAPYHMNDGDFQFIAELNKILAVVGIIALIGAVTLSFFLARSITKPLNEILNLTKKIA